MTCEGCSNAVTRVLQKLGGESVLGVGQPAPGSALGSSILEDNTVSKSSKLETFCSALILLLSW